MRRSLSDLKRVITGNLNRFQVALYILIHPRAVLDIVTVELLPLAKQVPAGIFPALRAQEGGVDFAV